MPSSFTTRLLEWNDFSNHRKMPWKGEKDPYRIWLSEVILQQTRVEQGWNYYNRFIETYPTVMALAQAEDSKVFKLWEGLGYYSRCRNLLATARLVNSEFGGKFPGSYDELIKLKGIGPYTAAAISSFAFDENQAVVDGNVQRVIARYFGVSVPAVSSAGKKLFHQLAQNLIDPERPAAYNQAIMDFGATICKPQQPLCVECVQNTECEAFLHNKVSELPFKAPKPAKKNRWFNYFVIESDANVYIHERVAKDIWQHLFEFLMVETSEEVSDPTVLLRQHLTAPYKLIKSGKQYRQVLSHQVVHARFNRVTVSDDLEIEGLIRIKKEQLNQYPFPRVITLYLQAEPANSADSE